DNKYLIFGKPAKYGNSISFVHPEMDLLNNNHKIFHPIYPVYHSTEKLKSVGLNSKGISQLVTTLLQKCKYELQDNLSDILLKKHHFLSRKISFEEIHFPSSYQKLKNAIRRFKYEELFFLQIALLKQKKIRQQKNKSFIFSTVGERFNDFYFNYLDFELTNAQKRVVTEIRKDVLTGFQMNRLLQGDVGSGKTVVAILSMLLANDNEFQSCLMAPTEILATQHFNSIKQFSDKLNLNVVLLTGKTSVSEKKNILSELRNQSIDIIVGTHALIQDNVTFSQLGLVIIDEQHKFGVAQRAKLWKNKDVMPHVLVMTATPIPRTLAMTAYGNLDLSVIDEMPPNRKKIITTHKYDKDINEVYKFIYQQLTQSRQVYVVYPLIEESQVLDYKNLLDGYDNMKMIFEKKGFQISMLHGRLTKEQKEMEMARFLQNKTQLLVSTTVIEVGVNVPNATTMVVQNAEKFGLSQLHQLRGRVGRSSYQSHCILVTSNKLTQDARQRLKAMVDTNDGFKISEIDLKLRGPGDVLGTRQSGLLNLKLASLVKDYELVEIARKDAVLILANDADLSHIDNHRIFNFFINHYQKLLKWSTVS
ncbi:MAG: ATP-dependent DNA helicase RecG, partial [Flavobacteriales bacterium]|nr:ATP-dependent DNA helicase RecG [Flavobacteriales bacterium]